MSNPIEELLRGMRSMECPKSERRATWRDRMAIAVDELSDSDEAMLVIRRDGKTRVIKSDNGTAHELLSRAITVCKTKNIK